LSRGISVETSDTYDFHWQGPILRWFIYKFLWISKAAETVSDRPIDVLKASKRVGTIGFNSRVNGPLKIFDAFLMISMEIDKLSTKLSLSILLAIITFNLLENT
jgi:hypothetical protein